MAQLSSAQREPSMEEILASIRRIIEDSDGGRRPGDAAGPVPPSLAAAQPLVEAPSAEIADRRGPAEVIEVETFRGAPQDEARGAAPPRPISLAEVQAQLAAERESREAGEPEMVAPPPIETSDSSSSSFAEVSAISEWRLGVAEPEPESAPAEPDLSAEADLPTEPVFDVDEVANAVLQDVTASQSFEVQADEAAAVETPAEPVRLSLISDRTGRQVAASFNELAEALAARSRRSMEDMAEEMLRPMLQDWLDNNLPTLVERLVREEIERVARGT